MPGLARELSLRVAGSLACFTRPEFKTERMSYPVLTPSAARGILEAVLWKPAIRWRIQRIKVLAPIRWTSFRRNEVAVRGWAAAAAVIARGGAAPCLLVEDARTQRTTTALRDVDYVIEARFEMTRHAGREDNPTKFVEMFRRRVERGQHFQAPYLGCREFPAEILPVDENTPPPITETRDLGWMLWDVRFEGGQGHPLFFAAQLDRGVVHVPDDPAATAGVQAEEQAGETTAEKIGETTGPPREPR